MNLEILNERQTEEIYQLKRDWLRRCRRERRGPPFLKIGRMVKYRKCDIETYLEKHLQKTEEK